MHELLAPAGDMEKLKFALNYGADAVYLGGKSFGMRANAGNFTLQEMEEAVSFAHENGKKVYVTLNIAARNDDFGRIISYIKDLDGINIDAIIAADPGVIFTIKDVAPDLKVSLSTQASTTNYKSLEFWKENGIDRVILARELSFNEIKGICQNKPKGMEVEMFVHGAMCISYSGRCLLSNYLTDRDANRGDCAQPCRWNYRLIEEKREGEYFPVEEHKEGTFIFNSKDLCLINHMKELIDAGVDSFKIEGRMKSVFYVSTIVNAYRKAIDDALLNKPFNENLYEELKKVSHRQYTRAFYDGNINESSQNYGTSSYTRNYDFIAQGICYDKNKNLNKISQRNKFYLGDEIEIIMPNKEVINAKVEGLFNEKMEQIDNAPHATETLFIKLDKNIILNEYALLRKNIV